LYVIGVLAQIGNILKFFSVYWWTGCWYEVYQVIKEIQGNDVIFNFFQFVLSVVLLCQIPLHVIQLVRHVADHVDLCILVYGMPLLADKWKDISLGPWYVLYIFVPPAAISLCLS
jgi:hypothetical protein